MPSLVNRYQYNGIELLDDWGLNLNTARYRTLDPQLGRWWQLDPEVEQFEAWSAYNSNLDNPIRYADPEGDCPWCVVAGVVWAAYEVGSQIYDTYDAYKTVTNPKASTGAKVASVAGVIVDVVAPGGGYGHVGKEAVEQVAKHGDDVVDAVKTVEHVKDGAKAVEGAKNVTKTNVTIDKPYKRPSGSVTQKQRQSVQNKPCVDCGKTEKKMIADHKKALVEEYYETGTIDVKKMRDVNSVQPQCPTCSAKQGAEKAQYSKQQKKAHGFD